MSFLLHHSGARTLIVCTWDFMDCEQCLVKSVIPNPPLIVNVCVCEWVSPYKPSGTIDQRTQNAKPSASLFSAAFDLLPPKKNSEQMEQGGARCSYSVSDIARPNTEANVVTLSAFY